MTSLRHSLGLQKGGVISIVGGGGKTALMFRLARELATRGDRVLTTTSTKVRVPVRRQTPIVWASDSVEQFLKQAGTVLKRYSHMTAGRRILHFQKKLIGFTARDIDRIWSSRVFNWIIVEADGAAGKPLKAPAAHEPVVPETTQWLIGVVGLSVVGKPLNAKWVFRPQLVSALTGLAADSYVTAAAVAELCLNETGIMKNAPKRARKFIFLNQAESEKRFGKGKQIARTLVTLGKNRINGVLVGQTIFEPIVKRYYIIS
jgi:probable selenium-dependent hydroxylase accessory protein YqeC